MYYYANTDPGTAVFWAKNCMLTCSQRQSMLKFNLWGFLSFKLPLGWDVKYLQETETIPVAYDTALRIEV